MRSTKEQPGQTSGALARLKNILPRKRVGPARRARSAPLGKTEIDALTKRIILPSLPVSDEEMARATHQDRGQKLARQDNWPLLSQRIRYADETRLATPGGETASLLLALGARSDVVCAAEDALHDGQVPSMDGMASLEEVLEDEPGDYACALVVALAHLDIAWAWHSIIGEAGTEHSILHIKRADAILAPFDAKQLDSPAVAAARCSINATNESKSLRLQDDYALLISLDPYSHRHMRALGRHMLQHLSKVPNCLEVEARKTAARTQEQWGSGGYTWVYFDALSLEPSKIGMLDPEFFVEGLHDIITRKPDQHIVNLLTAFCAITMSPDHSGDLPIAAETARASVHDCIDWLLSDHLQELHPLIWSQTLLAPGQVSLLPSRRALVVKGRQTALRIIASRFADEIADGSSIAFSPSGMYRLPSI